MALAAWLPFYAATDDGHRYTQTGWQAFGRFDVLLMLLAVLAVALAVCTSLGRSRPADRLRPAVALLAPSGAGLLFYRLFTAADAPSGGYAPLAGADVTLAALVASRARPGSAGDAADLGERRVARADLVQAVVDQRAHALRDRDRRDPPAGARSTISARISSVTVMTSKSPSRPR